MEGSILITIFLSNTVYSLPSIFLPTFLADHNINAGWTGLIFATYAISIIIVSPLVGLLINKLSHATIMACGCILMSISFGFFSLINRLDDNPSLIAICIILRFLQGTASSMINTSAYAFAAQNYSVQIEKAISLIECVVGLGLIAGPIIGSTLYAYYGFSKTFIVFSIMMLPCTFLDYFMLRKMNKNIVEDCTHDNLEISDDSNTSTTKISDNSDTSSTEDKNVIIKHGQELTQRSIEAQDFIQVEIDELQTRKIHYKEVKKIGYCELLRKPRIFFAASVAGLDFLTFCIFEPTLNLRLHDYELSNVQVGLIFSIEPISYLLSTFLSPYVVPKWVESRVTLILSSVLLGVLTSLVGPFYADKSLITMCIAFFFSGISLGTIMVFNMGEMMRGAKEAYPDCDMSQSNNLLSGILNSTSGIGQALGPVCGGMIFDLFGFHWMCNITAFICIGFGILYFGFAGGSDAFQKTYAKFSGQCTLPA